MGKRLGETVRAFNSHIHEERFGTLAECIPKLLAMQKALQWGFDLDTYLGSIPDNGHVQAVDRANEDGSTLAELAATIGDESFWSYLLALSLIADALAYCNAWVDSCPCHWLGS